MENVITRKAYDAKLTALGQEYKSAENGRARVRVNIGMAWGQGVALGFYKGDAEKSADLIAFLKRVNPDLSRDITALSQYKTFAIKSVTESMGGNYDSFFAIVEPMPRAARGNEDLFQCAARLNRAVRDAAKKAETDTVKVTAALIKSALPDPVKEGAKPTTTPRNAKPKNKGERIAAEKRLVKAMVDAAKQLVAWKIPLDDDVFDVVEMLLKVGK